MLFNTKRSASLLLILLVAFAAGFGIALSGDKGKKTISLRKPDIVDLVFVNYNNWSYVMRNNGSYMYDSPDADHNGNNAGGEFPRGSGVTVVYAGGIYIGTIKNGIPVVSETEFATEFQPGRITNSGVPFDQLKAEDPSLPSQKVYLIDKDNSSNWPDDALRDQFGKPALIADAQTWAVFNDIDTSLNQESEQESLDPGLGIQVTLESYAFNSPKIGDVIFMRYILTNKTNSDYTQSYFGIWNDPDVGPNAANDIVGTDTTRGMEYVYNNTNETPNDRAIGFDFFQGPVVNTTEIPARDLLRNQYHKTILKYDPRENRFSPQSLSNNQIIIGLVSSYQRLQGMEPRNNFERYNVVRGAWQYGSMRFGCGIDDYFVFRGNPITEQGTCDVAGVNNPRGGLFSTGSDQRILLSTGPFTIKAGESQEIWVGVVGASGHDRLDAVANLFATDDLAQSFFDAGFPAPAPPEIPNLSVTALDGRIALTWQNNAEVSEDLAGELLGISVANGYNADYVKHDFQGYRVYRSLTGLEGSFQLLAQYDVVDTLGLLSYRFLNNNFGLEIREMDFGSNTGLRYSFIDSNLTDGQNYFYSVTAYDAQPYIAGPDSILFDGQYILKPIGIPVSLESSILSNSVSAVPQRLSSSYRYNAMTDSSMAHHAAGLSNGYVQLEVVDPAAVVDGSYSVTFHYLPDSADHKKIVYNGNTQAGQMVFEVRRDGNVLALSSKVDDPQTWIDGGNGILDMDADGNLINGDSIFDDRFFSTSYTVTSASAQFFNSSIISSPSTEMELLGICEGTFIRAFGPPSEVLGWSYSAGTGTGFRWMTGVNFGFEQFFGGLTVAPNPSDTILNVDIVFSNNPSGWSTVYGHTGAFGLVDETFLVPFKAYEVDPRDGDATPHELNVVVRDANDLNGWYLDNTLGGDGTGPQTRSYTTITNRPYDNGSQDAVIWGHSLDQIPAMLLFDMAPRTYDGFTWNELAKHAILPGSDGGATITLAEQDTIYRNIPDNGTFHILANHVITTNDIFTYSTAARTAASKSDIKRALKDIKVVPNPFYKYSSFETSFDKLIKFTNLPSSCTIRIFTVAGDLIRTLNHNTSSNNDRVNNRPYDDTYTPADDATSIERWDLKTANGRYVASGMYIALIESSAGKRFVKFAVIQ